MKTIIRLPKIEIVVQGGEENGRILHTYEGSDKIELAYSICRTLRHAAISHGKKHIKYHIRVT